MGKVKNLRHEQREKALNARIKELMAEGMEEFEATEMAYNEQEEEDEASEQFGVGA